MKKLENINDGNESDFFKEIDMCAEMDAKRKREQFITNVAYRPAESTLRWFVGEIVRMTAEELGISEDELWKSMPHEPASFERTHRDQSAIYIFRDEHKRAALEIDKLLPDGKR